MEAGTILETPNTAQLAKVEYCTKVDIVYVDFDRI